jgi:hypothetical protein
MFVSALLVALPLALDAQKGKPKPPSSLPGTAVFVCNAAGIELCSDGIVGDGTNYLGFGSNETGSGAHLTGAGELWLGSGAVGYEVTLDFRGQTGACGTACRWDWVNDQRVMLMDFELQTNAVNGTAGTEIANGLLGIGVGTSAYARIKLNFLGPGGFLYELRFNSLEAAGSTAVAVTRTDSCTWEFTDDGALAHFKSGARKTLVNEGLFSMPFSMTVNIPGCVPGSD